MQQARRSGREYRQRRLAAVHLGTRRNGRADCRIASIEDRGDVVEIARRRFRVDRCSAIGKLDRRGVRGGDRTAIIRNAFMRDDMMDRERTRIGEFDAQYERVEAFFEVWREHPLRRQKRQRFAKIGAHVLIRAAPLEITIVTGKIWNFCAQQLQRLHSARGTTRLREGPRSLRGKILTVKPATAWPAYLVAAACFAIALISSIANISLLGQIRQQQRELASLSERSTALARNLANVRVVLFDVLDTRAHHYQIGNGEVITRGSRIYLALRALPEPPRGKVYQAWTLAKGSTKVLPSPTFLPDARGAALVVLTADARTTAEVSVTLEPDGGSKEPTSKPLMDVAFAD
jgi:cell division protein FtsB